MGGVVVASLHRYSVLAPVVASFVLHGCADNERIVDQDLNLEKHYVEVRDMAIQLLRDVDVGQDARKCSAEVGLVNIGGVDTYVVFSGLTNIGIPPEVLLAVPNYNTEQEVVSELLRMAARGRYRRVELLPLGRRVSLSRESENTVQWRELTRQERQRLEAAANASIALNTD